MKKSVKTGLGITTLGIGVLLISSCTANFCSNTEKAKMLYNLDQGVTVYVDADQISGLTDEEKIGYEKLEGNENIYSYVPVASDGTYLLSSSLNSVIKAVSSAGGYTPSLEYFKALDEKVLEAAVAASGKTIAGLKSAAELTSLIYDVKTNTVSVRNEDEKPNESILHKNGYLKYYSTDEDALWGNYQKWTAEIILEDNGITEEMCPSHDFSTQYKTSMENSISANRSCIATVDGEYGTYGDFDQTISINKKTWKYAWKEGGFIEGLLVYPVAWMVDSFTALFGGAGANGVNQLLALIIVTFIVRLFIFACTFPSTLQQQKMQAIQPQLAKLQAKYPNSNTNQAEKQRLAQEQMELYKKNGVKPFAQIIVMIIQFPVFIGVWGAMQGSSALSTGTILGLKLSSSISSALMNFAGWPKVGGWWTAAVLFILMAVSQVLSMKVPQWIQNKQNKKMSKLGKNPAADQQNKTMKMVSWVMVIMIIFMGFTLPAALGVYWFIGAIISLIQSLVTQAIAAKQRSKK
ncbi:MAG: membrane protein insertase YidC [Bacilli bacterium]|nr:membrane protein insertase YidC [Bacilli bacterium]